MQKSSNENGITPAQIAELQQEITDTFFWPEECDSSLYRWELLFETAAFQVGAETYTAEYVESLAWYYHLLKHIRQMAAISRLKK